MRDAPPARRCAAQSGFTLMEVMVAAALLAMMGLIIATSITSVMGAIRDNREMQDRYHAARVALGRVQRELSMAYLSRHQNEDGTTKTAFIGKSKKLIFTYMGHRRMARNVLESDQGVVEYALEREPGSNLSNLVRREKVIIDDTPEKEGHRQVLIEGVRELEFEYWNLDKETWQPDWKVVVDKAAEEKRRKQQIAAVTAGMTGNVALGNELAKQSGREKKHGADEGWLPARVRIRIVVSTWEEDVDLEFTTQTRIRLQEPLELGKPYTPQAYENTLNPYAAVPAVTPSGFTLPNAAGAIGGLFGGGTGGGVR